MTRCLITGLGGFVASHLADYLLEHTDWHIYGLVRWRSDLRNIQHLVGRINTRSRVHLCYGDLRDEYSLRACLDASEPHYTFHLAAQSYPQTSFIAPVDTIDTNTQGTLRLLQAIRECVPNPVVHVCSSSEVYGRAKTTPIAEDAPFHPASPYAISKVGADLIAQHYAEAYGMHIVITRMFTHTGPRRGDVFMESSFAKQIAMIERGMIEPCLYHGNLASLRTVADVRDAVAAYHLAVTKARPGVYNIGGNYTDTVGGILQSLSGYANVPLFTAEDPARLRPIDADNQVPDCTKFKREAGWEPLIPFEKTMLDLLNYWRERVKTETPLQR